MAGTLLTPQAGSPNSTEDPKISTAIAALNSNLDGSNLLDPARLTAGTSAQLLVCNGSGVPTYRSLSGDVTTDNTGVLTIGANKVTDPKLASPNNSAYRTITKAEAAAAGAVGTYFFGATTTAAYPNLVVTGTALQGGGTPNLMLGLIHFASADYAVAGLTQKLRIRQQVIVGSVSPSTVTLNCGLYPVTISAGNWTLGTVVPNSATTTTGLATNTISPFTSASGDFTIPSDGAYCLGVVVGSITCPSGIYITAQLQTRNV